MQIAYHEKEEHMPFGGNPQAPTALFGDEHFPIAELHPAYPILMGLHAIPFKLMAHVAPQEPGSDGVIVKITTVARETSEKGGEGIEPLFEQDCFVEREGEALPVFWQEYFTTHLRLVKTELLFDAKQEMEAARLIRDFADRVAAAIPDAT